MVKILMVCLGNICRSPLAEGILRSKLSTNTIVVDSAGTGNYHIGKKPDLRAISIARKHALDISNLKARQFEVSDFDNFDHIYVMDESNYRNLIQLARNDQDKRKIKFIMDEVYPNQNYNVPDPYYGGNDGFESVFNMLDEACTLIAAKLQ
ncbi:low molecular weight protein-tyrosine-phosphatase [Mariniflexile maritimum]|uniref:low molecular weight protein-tyrosine-phosphatase n=1 Tax=Mariniflexile maritimum TaxID=2682493 RepID=UPI0012F644DF|nr:low molecular weight protein-tyrosine-phosphatase [Mariniflexile maritimum]